MMKLMLVEDEYLLNKTIRTYLSGRGFTVDGYLDGLEAIDAVGLGYDLFIVDIDIPQVNGITILEHIRTFYPQTPVIMISATIEMEMITKAYTSGCSDYLKKPFDIKELELKIKAFTRSVDKIALGDEIFYEKEAQQLLYKEEQITLTSQENTFLLLLLDNRGRVVPNEKIEMMIWGIDNYKPPLRQLINRLRKKIPVDIVENRIGEGYIIV
jgi:DNA-binding response OmpR family regulator